MQKITEHECRSLEKEYIKRTGNNYKRLDKYTHSHTKMRLVCPKHGEFEKGIGFFKSNTCCPKCSKDASKELKLIEKLNKYKKFLAAKNLNLIGEFKTSGRLNHSCLTCGSTFLSLANTLRAGKGCPYCEGRPVPTTKTSYTEVEFKSELKEKHKDIKLKNGTFLGRSKQAIFKCSVHGIFECRAGYVLRSGCPSCKKEAEYATRTLDKQTWDERIRNIHGDTIRLLGQYTGQTGNKKYRFKCYVCFNTWKCQISAVGLSGTGCPHCNNHKNLNILLELKNLL